MSIFGVAAYRRWLAADTAGEFGEAIKTFVFPMLALIATGAPEAAGLVGATGTVLMAVADLIGGNLADRLPKLQMLLWAAVCGGVLSLAWWLCLLLDVGALAWVLLIFTALYSIRYGLTASASTGLLVELLDEARIGPALAANQGRDATISLTGAPLGGFILGLAAWLAAPLLLLLDLIALIAVLRLRRLPARTSAETAPEAEPGPVAPAPAGEPVPAAPEGEPTPAAPEGEPTPAAPEAEPAPAAPAGFLAESLAGFRWIASRPDVLGGLSAAVLLSIGVGVAVSTQLYFLQQAGFPVSLIGLVAAAMGVGMLLGSTISEPLMTRFPGGALVLTCGLLMLICLAPLAWLHAPWQIGVLIGAFALGIPIFNAVMMGYILLAVPPQLLGRVNSAATIVNLAAAAMPPLIVGFLLTPWGRTNLALAATGTLAAAVVTIAANRALRGIPRTDAWKDYAAGFTR